ncbi:hypothetical protein CHL_0361 [Campylobacter hyointestinalis subsp. lawsonii CCUG 27631]|uniref:hypothetical protein n=1 Tax=Campylobacter hyointestinalis TaxID=198 RepID=UPI0007C907D0|nr:hypothetical protein [Campylobacter hyointestinalis]ANE33737.1 hypothetical protein CHL_0361 [Campylobacter hyointestinalis subsp. lawsonii CCUG 27631]
MQNFSTIDCITIIGTIAGIIGVILSITVCTYKISSKKTNNFKNNNIINNSGNIAGGNQVINNSESKRDGKQ